MSLSFLIGDLDNVIGHIENERDDYYCLFISSNSDSRNSIRFNWMNFIKNSKVILAR
jgi:hypothetical protein